MDIVPRRAFYGRVGYTLLTTPAFVETGNSLSSLGKELRTLYYV
jgi:hypothetical protein